MGPGVDGSGLAASLAIQLGLWSLDLAFCDGTVPIFLLHHFDLNNDRDNKTPMPSPTMVKCKVTITEF